MPARLVRRPGEVRNYSFDFHEQPEIFKDNDTIASVTSIVSKPDGLAFGSPSVVNYTDPNTGIVYNASIVKASISGGISGTNYYVECTVTLNSGAVLQCAGWLYVGDLA